MALNGGRVGCPVFFFSTQQIDLPVGTSARRRNSSRQLTITFVQSSHFRGEARLDRVEGSVTVAAGTQVGESYARRSLANSDAPRWSVPSCQYAIQQLYLSPRPLSLVRLFDFSLYICITYKGFHDELAALSAMVSARLAPPFSS